MILKNEIHKFYLDMTINELRLMNENHEYPNITYNSLMYLDIIAYKKNCTVSFIANALNISKSAVTIKINEFIKQNLVTKTQSIKDKRINYLSVNDNIIKEYKVYNKILNRAIKEIQADYSQEKIDTFCEILHALSGYFSKEKKYE